MTTIQDLPDELYILIAAYLTTSTLNSLIRSCKSLHSAFIPFLWSELTSTSKVINVDHVRAHAHHVETLHYSAIQNEEHYTIVYPRLQSLRLDKYSDRKRRYIDINSKPSIVQHQISSQIKVQFARRHPTVRKLIYRQEETLPMEFWETVETDWRGLESLEIFSLVEVDAVDSFWKVCDRLQSLDMYGVTLPSSSLILSTLSFRHLQDLKINIFDGAEDTVYRPWPLQLLEQVMKGSKGLRRLEWFVREHLFPTQMVQEALAEGCWPELCELLIKDHTLSEQDVTNVLRRLPSRRLNVLELWGGFGPLSYGHIREMTLFDHLKDLRLIRCAGATSKITQEIMTECVHLVHLEVPYIYVRDIATASKPWGCLKLEDLTVYITKQAGDEAGWELKAFQQISKLRELRKLNLQRDAQGTVFAPESQIEAIWGAETLNLKLPSESSSTDSNELDCTSSNSEGDLRCWSSLELMEEFTFDGGEDLGMEEMVWMTEHWKNLRQVCGQFLDAEEKGVRMDRFFAEKGILYFTFCVFSMK
ncbi:MAG: hypothetical protein JOS17DRAFT_762054 [Linnemannia elongata]|nr:MAG: hypothetical protein JOS17DRAFT_762054 [Linnemannia elongata]